MRNTNKILPDKPGHALIDIQPNARKGSDKVLLIADPLHFTPEGIQRVVRIIEGLLDSIADSVQRSQGMLRADFVSLHTEIPDRFSFGPAWRAHLRQRIIVSLIMHSGRTRAELVYANVDPGAFPTEEIDRMISRLTDLLNGAESAGVPALAGGRN